MARAEITRREGRVVERAVEGPISYGTCKNGCHHHLQLTHRGTSAELLLTTDEMRFVVAEFLAWDSAPKEAKR